MRHATTLPNNAAIGSLAGVRKRTSLLVISLTVALGIAVIGGWTLSKEPSEDYSLSQTVGSIALNKLSEGTMLATAMVQDVNDNLVSTELWLGEPLVINFWFSTCEPCRREFPVLVAADEQFDQVRFIGVNLMTAAPWQNSLCKHTGLLSQPSLIETGTSQVRWVWQRHQ